VLAPSIWLDLRFAPLNQLELVASVFLDTGSSISIPNSTVPASTGTFTGTLQFRTSRFGGLFGARFVRGNVWRFVPGGEVGVSMASYSNARLLNSNGQDVGLSLADTMQASFLLAPSAGIVWASDKLSVALVPRAELLVGPNRSWAFVLPLTIGWDF